MAESEEEVDVLVQRVVKDITNAFKRNPNIDEIGVIPCPEARYNRSPIVLVENKLGVESWCVKFLLPYVHNKLLLYRQRKHWLEREALADITCTLLLLNPDFTTAWNVRKELVQCGVLNPEKDLYLGQLALTKFPKSPETWIHRRWVLQQILGQCSAADRSKKPQQGEVERGDAERGDAERSQQLSEHLARTLHQEMKVCSDAACRYPSNYNAWSHRIWVLQHMGQGNVKQSSRPFACLRGSVVSDACPSLDPRGPEPAAASGASRSGGYSESCVIRSNSCNFSFARRAVPSLLSPTHCHGIACCSLSNVASWSGAASPVGPTENPRFLMSHAASCADP
ncbi:Protein prenyltransferase alpha subunit repeat-containing protein 1 [Dissostichus eleginoides]|nr:Protein prenyltransferase alpha subunit repeat-containing protein 1 [Dissostichus eleginoides]